MPDIPFGRSVFINCPFDDQFAPILQAVCFCVIYLGFSPRLAPENADNSKARLDRIVELIQGSKYGIHDLSRCVSTGAEEYFRMNMPFELGADFACQKFGVDPLPSKSILVLEKNRYDYQKALSDISGWDIEAHGNDPEEAVRKVRNWLVGHAKAPEIGASRIQGAYLEFQGWYWQKQAAAGASDEDIRRYPTIDVVKAMQIWKDQQKPRGKKRQSMHRA